MNASRDENNVPTMIAALESDGETLIRIKATPSHVLHSDNGSGGSDNGPGPIDLRDENSVHGLLAVSSADGVTPVVLYADAGGRLLIDSN